MNINWYYTPNQIEYLVFESGSGFEGAIEESTSGAVRYRSDPDSIKRNDVIGFERNLEIDI